MRQILRNSLLLGFMLLITTNLAFAKGFVNTTKSELTGERTHNYYLHSTNETDQFLRIHCSGNNQLEYTFCRYKYKNLPAAGLSCHLSYSYKFDDNPIQKKKYSSHNGYEKYKPMLNKFLNHSKLVVAPYPDLPSMPTPVFDLRGMAQTLQKMAPECTVPTTAPKPAAKAPSKAATPAKPAETKQAGAHKHGERYHTHPLPAQGVAHKHGNSAVGSH